MRILALEKYAAPQMNEAQFRQWAQTPEGQRVWQQQMMTQSKQPQISQYAPTAKMQQQGQEIRSQIESSRKAKADTDLYRRTNADFFGYLPEDYSRPSYAAIGGLLGGPKAPETGDMLDKVSKGYGDAYSWLTNLTGIGGQGVYSNEGGGVMRGLHPYNYRLTKEENAANDHTLSKAFITSGFALDSLTGGNLQRAATDRVFNGIGKGIAKVTPQVIKQPVGKATQFTKEVFGAKPTKVVDPGDLMREPTLAPMTGVKTVQNIGKGLGITGAAAAAASIPHNKVTDTSPLQGVTAIPSYNEDSTPGPQLLVNQDQVYRTQLNGLMPQIDLENPQPTIWEYAADKINQEPKVDPEAVNKETLNQIPILDRLKSVAPGMGIGAGLGGLAGYLSESDPRKKRRNLLLGGLAGAGLGALGNYAYNSYNK